MRIRTTPEEVTQYKALKAVNCAYRKMVDDASEKQRATYKAEGRPMVGTLDTPDFWNPKSDAIKAVDADVSKAMEAARQFRQKVGAKRLKRMHSLELAGLI